MARVATGDTVVVKPSNNVYTVLAIIGFVAELFAFLALFLRANDIFGSSLFSS